MTEQVNEQVQPAEPKLVAEANPSQPAPAPQFDPDPDLIAVSVKKVIRSGDVVMPDLTVDLERRRLLEEIAPPETDR